MRDGTENVVLSCPITGVSLGYDRNVQVVSQGDSAELRAFLFDDQDATVGIDDLLTVSFKIAKPDGSVSTHIGEIEENGEGFFRFDDTDLIGDYRVVATFTFLDGKKQSTRADFVVGNPFGEDLSTPISLSEWNTLTTADERNEWMVSMVASRVWDKMEDLFDSHDGGPWMRDMTLNVFSPGKIPEFIDEALFDINIYNPPTDFWIDKFVTPLAVLDALPRQNANLTILVQGTWIAVIRHLMRSYTEQPVPMGGQVTYEDRRDYLQRWGTIFQLEFQHYDHLVKLWKRQFLGLNQSKQLVSNKAGRLLPAPLRTRNIGRGYYLISPIIPLVLHVLGLH